MSALLTKAKKLMLEAQEKPEVWKVIEVEESKLRNSLVSDTAENVIMITIYDE